MADRDSAEIFRFLFIELAERVELENRHNVEVDKGCLMSIARKSWQESHEYDFSYDQLDCDEHLITLGLARRVGDDMEYRTHDCRGWK
jgi:hypothetical protein